jgi:rSAM/selenodomain-associated transferase 2/rSAM/selenodomain-associated transferase 1
MNFRRLIIFTRYPVPGITKTRLIPALGEQGAADLQREMTEHTLDTVRPLMDEEVRIEIRHEGGDQCEMADWLGEDLSFHPQDRGNLGARMAQAFRTSFLDGAGKTVIIGSDCPELTSGDVREAFNILDSNPVVLGPARDGGYYLIGIRASAPDRLFQALFSDIPWGSGNVLIRTVNTLADAGIDIGLLDEKNDVDEPEDLVHWERKIRIQNSEFRSQKEGQVNSKTRTRSRTWTPITSTATISVIIPTLNEEDGIGRLISFLKEYDVEIVVADGGSTDGTKDLCQRAGVKVLSSKTGRAMQMNTGASEATGQILLFLHADTILPEGFPEMVRGPLAMGAIGGAFSFGTDLDTITMRIIERMSNLRAQILGIVFGDQAIFTRADVFRKINGFPEIPVMEDYGLVRSLNREGKVVLLPQVAVTSARRWRTSGVWRTTFVNQVITWLFLLGVSPDKLAGWYRKKLRAKS